MDIGNMAESSHDCDADVSDHSEQEPEDVGKGLQGMTDVINKILNKSAPQGKSIILSKHKETVKRKQEIKEAKLAKKIKAQEKKAFTEQNHVKPTLSNAEKEVKLRRMATRGVVQLFNAVNKHQKEIESRKNEVKGEAKKDKVFEQVSKASFLDLLKRESGTIPMSAAMKKDEPKKSEEPGWSILRDDFMMGAKMKDWDKEDVAGEMIPSDDEQEASGIDEDDSSDANNS